MYIGNTPAENYASFLTETFTVSATASYTLSHAVTNENDIRLVINGVVQQPGSGKAYTASGTTLTLTSATASGDVMYCVYLGRALQTVNPPNASVGSAQIADSLISGKTALGATPADTDELLISDAGTLKRVDYSYLKSANTPAFSAYDANNQTIPNTTYTLLEFDTESFDTDSAYNTSTYKFTVPSGKGGKYLIGCAVKTTAATDRLILRLEKNDGNTFYSESNSDSNGSVQFNLLMDLSAGDHLKVAVYQNSGGNLNLEGGSGTNNFYGYKLT